MALKEIVPGVYQVTLGFVNAYLIDDAESGVTVVDTGLRGSHREIVEALSALGKQPSDVRRILLTHLHRDHTGGLAELERVTGAPAYMHPADAALVREGRTSRPLHPSPGLLPKLLYTFMRLAPKGIEPAKVKHEVAGDGGEVPGSGGIRAFHAPGHSAGQVVFLWPRHGGVLFAGDVAANMRGDLGWSIVYEDVETGRRTLQTLGAMDFEVACFGHGRPITRGAAAAIRDRWGPPGGNG